MRIPVQGLIAFFTESLRNYNCRVCMEKAQKARCKGREGDDGAVRQIAHFWTMACV